MLAEDEDAVICDLAQVYGVFDYTALPVQTAAVLACGLPPESRIMRRISGASVDTATLLLASAVDRLSVLCWRQTEDGVHGLNPPASVVDILLGREAEKPVASYASGADFEAARNRILAKVVKYHGV